MSWSNRGGPSDGRARWVARLTAGLAAVVLATGGLLAAPADGHPAAVSSTPVPARAVGISDSGKIAPALTKQLAAAQTDDQVHAIVVFAPADLSGITGSRRTRLATVEQRLRQHATRTQEDVRTYLGQQQAEGLVTRILPLWVTNEIGITATASVIRELAARPDVLAVRPDSALRAPSPSGPEGLATGIVEPNVSLVHAPDLWSLGFRGQHIVVASMDTGVDATHPDLAASWRGGSNSWYDPNGQHPTTPTDISGHGTQTMGVIVGGGAGGSSIGVAPDAQWIAAKIFNDQGVATTTGIHLAFQWLIDPDHDTATADAPNVVNNSWGASGGGCNTEFEQDLTALRTAGILPVFAAGNDGPTAGTILSPANLPEAFAVGGIDNTFTLDASSSRGPSACAAATAPRLVAPGVGIRTSDIFGGYINVTGTSIAAPHVAGALALLLSAFPGLSADQQQQALDAGALDLGATGWDTNTGYGALDVLASYQTLQAQPPDFSLAVAPSSRSVLAGATATYDVTLTGRNGFAADASLSLSGLTSAQATWSFTPPVVSGGSGTSQLNLAPATDLPPGTYPLTITATADALVRSTTASLVVLAPPPPPDFTLAATPTSRTAAPGSSVTYALTATGTNGFSGTVSLSASGLPASVTPGFSPLTIADGGTSTLTLTVGAGTPSGSYPFTVTGTDGSTTHSVGLTLVVAAKDFTISAAPSAVTVKHGKTAAYTISVAPIAGLIGKVAVAASGAPPGSTTTFSRVNIPLPGTATFKVHTSSATARGTFVVTITGTKGLLVHSTTVTVTVT